MGDVVRFPRHARASAGSRAAKAASVSKVRPTPFSAASRTSGAQCGAGIPPGRVRHPLTVESESESATATCPVPPSASMIEPGVSIEPVIVRSVRTSQEFASRETTFPGLHGPIAGMIDPPEITGPRLSVLRRALGFRFQKDFASEIGVEKNTYNPWETGKRPLTFEGALLIRKRFKVSLDYVFFGEVDSLSVRLRDDIRRIEAEKKVRTARTG
jgi:DNA-binding XRE family transcriptional regulator